MTSAPSTWRWAPGRGRCWPPLPEPAPTIVAEALHDVADALGAALDPGPARPAVQVAGAIAASLRPAEAADPAPDWLRPEQRASFRRVLAALDRYAGVLLADPVGSGKTWVALAVAVARAGAHPAVAVVPAALRPQWAETAARLGIPLTLHSHEALSRGRVPPGRPALVIVDESHRFRNPGIGRYRVLARWLVGRKVLLLSATPVVNRLADLAHPLRLGVRDDALATGGVADFVALLTAGRAHPALGDLIVSRRGTEGRPGTRRRVLAHRPAPGDAALLAGITELRLSTDPGTAALIRVSLWRALGSSRGALRGALVRYRRLLDHAAAAAAAGRHPTRAEIRGASDPGMEQLVMWPLLAGGEAPADLVLGDRPAIDRLVELLDVELTDNRSRSLTRLLADRVPTLVFTASRDTLRQLRERLAPACPAWLSGEAAGIGRVRLSRDRVLHHFRPGGSSAGGPTILLATDVAAEGLDLQRAARIVHFDLPWTRVRLDQREGRAVRLGALHREVEVLRFAPWPALDALLQQDRRLAFKHGLVRRAGLGREGRALFGWRDELADLALPAESPGIAMIAGAEPGWLVGLVLGSGAAGGGGRPPGALLWLTPDGEVIERPGPNVARLRAAARAAGRPPTDAERRQLLRLLTPVVRERLRLAYASAWLGAAAGTGRRRIIRRMQALAGAAARSRDQAMLSLAGEALAWLAGGVTAGEALLLEELAHLPAAELPGRWRRLRPPPRSAPRLFPRLTGVIGVTSFPP